MPFPPYPVSDLLTTAKSMLLHRAMFAEGQRDVPSAQRLFLAAAYLELVLAEDYRTAGVPEMVFVSRFSGSSCLWRGGRPDESHKQFQLLCRDYPDRNAEIQEALDELNRDYPLSGASSSPSAALPVSGASLSSPEASAPVS